jgi:hypothetical protein
MLSYNALGEYRRPASEVDDLWFVQLDTNSQRGRRLLKRMPQHNRLVAVRPG